MLQEESSGDSFEIAVATNQPEAATHKPFNYDDIYPDESMPLPGPTLQQQPQGDQDQPYVPYHLPPGAYLPPRNWPHSYNGPQEKNINWGKGPDDVPGPSMTPYSYYPSIFPGNPGHPVYQNYHNPRDGDIRTPQSRTEVHIPYHPPCEPSVDLNHTNIKSPIHKLYVDTQEDQYHSDESYKSVESNKDDGGDFE